MAKTVYDIKSGFSQKISKRDTGDARMATHSFKDLIVWQRAMQLTEDVYKEIESLPKAELYALSNQIKRCAVSVPSNIAEGQNRLSNKETIQFTSIALGSLGELQTQLLLCQRLYNIDTLALTDECEQIIKMLSVLIRSLRAIS